MLHIIIYCRNKGAYYLHIGHYLSSDFSQILYIELFRQEEKQVLLVVQPEVIYVYAREFTFSLPHFWACILWKNSLMSNISKMVTDITTGSMAAEYETTPWLSIGTMTMDDLELS